MVYLRQKYERCEQVDIHEIYREAGKLHGHYCPGLASGVRAGVLAAQLLETDPGKNKSLYCIYEKAACFVDGVQWTFGTTVGKGNLIYHPSGKAVFTFYDGESCDSVRLSLKRIEHNMTREELIDYILTGPAEEIFEIGPAKQPFPIRAQHGGHGVCEICGEEADSDKLVEKDGKILCIDCASV